MGFYYKSDSKMVGPFSKEQLKELIAVGTIKRDTPIGFNNLPDSKYHLPASRFPGLTDSFECYLKVRCPCCGVYLQYRSLKRGEAENLLEQAQINYKNGRKARILTTMIGGAIFAPIGIVSGIMAGVTGVFGQKPNMNNLVLQITCAECGKKFPARAYSQH